MSYTTQHATFKKKLDNLEKQNVLTLRSGLRTRCLITNQLFRIHIVQDPLGVVLRVVPRLHYSEQELGGVVLELEDEVHTRLAEGVDIVQDQRRYDVQSVAFVCSYAVLVLVTGTWQVLLYIYFAIYTVYRKKMF